MRAPLVAFAIVMLCTSAVWPDEAAELSMGTRVRVTAPGGKVKGVVLAADPETLTLVVEDQRAPIRLGRNSIRSIEVSAPRSAGAGAARAAGRGFLLGGGAGLVIGAFLLIGDGGVGGNNTRAAALAPLVFGGWSALAGAAIGAVNPGEGWRPLSTERVAIGLTTPDGRGVGLGVSVSF